MGGGVDFLSCGVCLRMYTLQARRPIVMPCGHTLCEECITGNPEPLCPFDRTPYVAEHCAVNFALKDAVQFFLSAAVELSEEEQQEGTTLTMSMTGAAAVEVGAVASELRAEDQAAARARPNGGDPVPVWLRRVWEERVVPAAQQCRQVTRERVVPAISDFTHTKAVPALQEGHQRVVVFANSTVRPALAQTGQACREFATKTVIPAGEAIVAFAKEKLSQPRRADGDADVSPGGPVTLM